MWLAYQTLREGIQPGWPMLLVFVFWVLVAYLVLPRLHRILSTIYVPDYFIGRAGTGKPVRQNKSRSIGINLSLILH